MSEEMEMKIKLVGSLMSEKRKNEKGKLTVSLTIFSENGKFQTKMRQVKWTIIFQHAREKDYMPIMGM